MNRIPLAGNTKVAFAQLTGKLFALNLQGELCPFLHCKEEGEGVFPFSYFHSTLLPLIWL